MVKNGRLAPLDSSVSLTAAERKILGGPCYEIAAVKKVAKSSQNVNLVTKDCSSDVAQIGMDIDDVADVLSNVSSAHYHGSEWCRTSHKSLWFPCDAYTIWYTFYDSKRSYQHRAKFYLKFFLSGNGDLVMFVSFHESDS